MSYQSRSCVLIYLLVLCLLSSRASSEPIQTSISLSDERISVIQTDLLKVQSDILGLNTAVAIGGKPISPELKSRLTTLEGHFQVLKQQLADERRESIISGGKYGEAITTLTNYYNTLDIQMNSLQKLMDDRNQDEARRPAHLDIANDIQNHRFAEAQANILKAEDTISMIPKIVHEVYANSSGNIDVLLDFAKALTKVDLAAYVLKATEYEMQSNAQRDIYKMMRLAKILKTEVVDQSNGSIDVKQNASEALKEINVEIANNATKTLKAAMYSDNYQKNFDVESLAKAVDNYNSEVSDEVMQRIVNEVFDSIEPVKIADNIYSNEYIPQIVAGLVALFQKLKSINDLNNNAVLTIGEYLKQLMQMENYAKLSSEKRIAIEDVINSMPTCARSLLFFDSVCIWNRGRREYLHAASGNSDRRSIFTWGTGEAVIQGDWLVEKYGDKFYFKSKAQENEYLYAVGVSPYDSKRRYVRTRVSGGYLGNKSAWNVELSGDYCYLRNVEFNEYLYASSKMHSSHKRYVFTRIAETFARQESYQWQIKDC